MASVKLRLLATYYRVPAAGASGSTVYKGQTFETDSENAERLVAAGAAEEVTAPQAKTDGEGDPDTGAAPKPPRKTAASAKTAADTGDTK